MKASHNLVFSKSLKMGFTQSDTLNHSFAPWLFLNASEYNSKCRHVRIEHDIPVMVLLVPCWRAANIPYSPACSRAVFCRGSYLHYSGSSCAGDFTSWLSSSLPFFIYKSNKYKTVLKCSSNEYTSQMLFYSSSSPFATYDSISSLHFLQILLGEWQRYCIALGWERHALKHFSEWYFPICKFFTGLSLRGVLLCIMGYIEFVYSF